jgi:DNA modification methylase
VSVRIISGDALTELRRLPAESVHCCVTSPPYYGLRDYGCAGQIGLEASPDEYIAALVAVFREVRRVLRRDGTLWLNVGDSYGAQQGRGFNTNAREGGTNRVQEMQRLYGDIKINRGAAKPKDLLGTPWMLAFALRADGWYLRQDIIWSKPNPKPESVTDRCTKAHEYLFLLSRSERYWFDAAAIAEPLSEVSLSQIATYRKSGESLTPLSGLDISRRDVGGRLDRKGRGARGAAMADLLGRNKRSVWTVSTQPYSEAHFATFPPALIEPCILAGCPKGGTVLDPFGGAGTTGVVADRLQRSAILIELNPSYSAMGRRRIENDAGLFAEVELSDAAE